MIDLNPNHLAIVERILAEHVPECEVRAFGSRASWTAKDYSDLDLAIVGDGSLDWRTLGLLKEAFEESDLPMRVDVLDWHDIAESFQRVIERYYVVVQERRDRVTLTDSEWSPVALAEVCTKVGSGATPRGGKEVYLQEGPYALIRSQNVYNDRFEHEGLAYIDEQQASALRNVEVLKDDVLLNITGDSVARACQVPPDVLPARVNQHVAIVRPDPAKLEPRYLHYSLVSPEMQVRLLSWAGQGATRNALTKGMIESLEIPLPPLPEQRAIAHVLGTLDDKIDLNRRMNETLEEMARALFRSWFVDFDPVRAKMEGRDTGLPPEVAALFPDRLVPSELGEIPEGWEVKPLDNIATFLNGLALQKYPANGGSTLPVIKIAQLRAGHTLGADLASGDLPRGYHVHDGDVLFSWSGSLELEIWAGGEGALNQHLFKVSSDEHPKWLYYWWTREHLPDFREIAADKATTMGHIQRHHLSEALTVVPNATMLEAIGRHMQPLLDRSLSLRIASRALAVQRDALLPRLVSGEVKVEGE